MCNIKHSVGDIVQINNKHWPYRFWELCKIVSKDWMFYSEVISISYNDANKNIDSYIIHNRNFHICHKLNASKLFNFNN